MIKIIAKGNIEEESVEITREVLNGSDGEILAIICDLIDFYVTDEKRKFDDVMKDIKETYYNRNDF